MPLDEEPPDDAPPDEEPLDEEFQGAARAGGAFCFNADTTGELPQPTRLAGGTNAGLVRGGGRMAVSVQSYPGRGTFHNSASEAAGIAEAARLRTRAMNGEKSAARRLAVLLFRLFKIEDRRWSRDVVLDFVFRPLRLCPGCVVYAGLRVASALASRGPRGRKSRSRGAA